MCDRTSLPEFVLNPGETTQRSSSPRLVRRTCTIAFMMGSCRGAAWSTGGSHATQTLPPYKTPNKPNTWPNLAAVVEKVNIFRSLWRDCPPLGLVLSC